MRKNEGASATLRPGYATGRGDAKVPLVLSNCLTHLIDGVTKADFRMNLKRFKTPSEYM